MEKLKRYLIFLVGLFVNSLGVSLITWKLYHLFQYLSDRTAVDHPEKEL